MDRTNRRQFLKTAGGTALGLIAVGGMSALAACTQSEGKEPKPTATVTPTPTATPISTSSATPVTFPWPYKKLDPVAAAERSYQAYYNGGCMYGALEGIVGELRAAVGQPYDSFPTAISKYGGAGVAGWGTLCGALNGAAAAIYLVHDSKFGNPIINEVFGWYGAEALPNYKPKSPKFPEIATTVADSQLCHPSVTKWCDKSKFKTGSPERAERCAWLTASVVRYTVELLNKQAEQGSITLLHAVPADAKACITCHGKGGILENVHITSQTSCTTCHDVLPASHPR